VDRPERRAFRGSREPLHEPVDRRGERQLDGREAPTLVHGTRRAVRRKHLELDHVGTALAQLRGCFAHELGSDTAPARLGPHVDDVEEPSALALFRRDGKTNVVSEQDDILADRSLERAGVVFRVVVTPLGVRDLGFEGTPQLAHEREVVGGRGPDHGMRCASSR
jgi:hypothetical protein